MKTWHYRMSFLSPAFLGDAEQAGRWRTPPIKALLRQWWRVAYAADHGHRVDVAAMRLAEGRLFGAAADDGDSRRSRVRVRLDNWAAGQMKQWPADDPRVHHPEVKRNDRPAPVGAQLYLGFGPLDSARGTVLKRPPAVDAGERAELAIALLPQIPHERADQESARLETALALMHLYGTVGGRSRNGWGSFSLDALEQTPPLPGVLGAGLTRPWRQCLGLDWPHAIGSDERGPLVWQSEPDSDWKSAMRRLAEIKIGLRTQFVFRTGPNAPQPEDRHWLSYPVTHHSVRAWGGNARLPNTMRFKLRRDAGDPARIRATVFHVPCRPPPKFNPDLAALERVWAQVHTYLAGAGLQRVNA